MYSPFFSKKGAKYKYGNGIQTSCSIPKSGKKKNNFFISCFDFSHKFNENNYIHQWPHFSKGFLQLKSIKSSIKHGTTR